MLQANQNIGPYRLIRKIGQGQYGVVWLADRSSTTASPVALKIPLDPDIDLDALLQEITLWARVSNHTNVMPIIEARKYDGQIVIVSELALDGSLLDWLKTQTSQTLSTQKAVDLTLGILEGLTHLHEKQIIHRDLKPANILLQGDVPRLSDFGLARICNSSIHSNIIAGTNAYMAPEAFDSVRNEQTDVWSAGVIFYELLTGSRPFPQRDTASLIGAITRYPYIPLPKTTPAPIQEIIALALAKDPQKRFETAAAMRNALLTINQKIRLESDLPLHQMDETTQHTPNIRIKIQSDDKPTQVKQPQIVNAAKRKKRNLQDEEGAKKEPHRATPFVKQAKNILITVQKKRLFNTALFSLVCLLSFTYYYISNISGNKSHSNVQADNAESPVPVTALSKATGQKTIPTGVKQEPEKTKKSKSSIETQVIPLKNTPESSQNRRATNTPAMTNQAKLTERRPDVSTEIENKLGSEDTKPQATTAIEQKQTASERQLNKIEKTGNNESYFPVIIFKDKIQYTEAALRNKTEGVVILDVMFNADGRISDIRTVKSLPDGLTERAIQVARRVRFRPATKNGSYISVRHQLEFTFKLHTNNNN